MLALRKRKIEAVTLPLPGGATAKVRPATAADVDQVSAEIQALVAGSLASMGSLALVSLVLGEEFDAVDLTDSGMLARVATGLSRLKLASVCCEEWSGVVGEEDGETLDLNIENLALLLQDSRIAAQFDAVINSKRHAEVKEKNASAASPTGAAAAAEPTAPNALPPVSPVPLEGQDQTATSAPKPSTLQ
jgi:hypothetical protein